MDPCSPAGDATPQTMSRYLTDLWRFSDWLADHAPDVMAPALLSRAVLEDYLLWVRRESGWKPAMCSHRVFALRLLLEEQAEDGRFGLPRGAVIHRTELPRVDYRLPKQLGGGVFDQWSTRLAWRCWITSSTGRSCCCSRSPASGHDQSDRQELR